MEVQFGPNSVDEPSLLYKLQRKIKVFNVNDPLPNRGYNLVASSSKYGLVFIGVPDGTLSVYQLNQVIDNDCEPKHLKVQLQEKPTHISVSCDHELLAVTGGKLLAIYKVADFQNPNVSPALSIHTEIEPPTYVTALQWNPCIPDSIVIAYFDGTLLACLVNSGQFKKVTGRARCICWSPKGKQFVTGNSDGTLIQYKPELTAAKLIPAPNLFEGAPVEAIAIYWISTFQFAVVYRNASDDSRPAVTIVNTPKGAPQTCVSYEDICYSMGSNRPWYYYLHGLAQWNLIMTSSSNSMEIGTLGSTDGANWMQWSQSDEARPELPLTDKKVENYPVGLSIDTCAIHQLPWGENDTLPHMPLLHVISQHGLLTIFNIINLKKDQMQVCSPPQLLALPAQAMISAIPGVPHVVPKPVTPSAPVPVAVPSSIPTPVVQKVQIPTPQPAPQQPIPVAVSAPIKIPSFAPQSQLTSATAASSIFQPQQRVIPETVSAPATQPAPTQPVTVAQPKPQPKPTAIPSQLQPQSQPQSQPQPTVPKPLPQENAALKAEQEKASKAKANQELKDMLVKEVNDFQMELYNFMVKTRETQARLQRDIENISTNFNGITLDAEELKKECSMEELRGAIVQLKLELVRACAVVAEARTHSDTKDLHQWSQADPLTTKRVASVKKLAYYVQTQLAQAHAALDYKWNELSSRDSQSKKLGPRMIRPILDDVYQPLVKQQEILVRQQAVLRTLKSALEECEVGPVFKSTSMLRSTPFKNKDPLSKLTKNILNMSLEPESKPKRHVLTPSKLDALRDVLSNHKTVKIKPVNVELRQHLETLRKNYEKSVKDKAEKVQPMPASAKIVKITEQKPKAVKPEPVKPVPTSIFTPVANVKFAPAPASVVRSLFAEAPKQETTRSVFKPFEYTAQKEAISSDTKSVLKDVLTNRQASTEAKNNNNIFMGQKICSPVVFGQTSAPTPSSAPTAVFTAKPIAEMSNMFNKFQPQPFVPESKSSLNARQPDAIPKTAANIKSSETGEPEDNEAPKPKPMTNLFGLKTPLAASTPLPTTLKAAEVPQAKPQDKVAEKTKDNVPKTDPKAAVKKETKPLTSQASNKGFVFGAPSNEATGSSIATPKPQSAFTVPSSSVKTEPLTPTESETSSASSSASSIFGAAVASLPITTSASIPTSVFTSTPTTTVFGSPLSQISPNKLGTTSANSIFEPVTTSQPIFSNTLPPLSQSASHPHVGYVTERLKAAAEENAGESVFKQESPTIVPLNPNVGHLQATYITNRLKYQTGDLPASNPIFKPTPSLQPTSTTTSTSESNAGFGSSSVSVKSVFGSSSSAFGTTTSTTASVFGVPSVADSTVTITSVPSSAATSESESSVSSASPTAATAATTPPAYDLTISASSTTSSSSVFGTPTAAVATTATTPSIFGTVTSSTATTSTPSIFGSIPAVASTATTTPTAFGSSVSNASPSPSVFASPQAEATSAFTPTTSSIFGGSSQAASVFAQASSSIFGTTTQASIFGATTQASIFGSPSNTTQASIFGTPTAITQASIFGTPTQASSVFGSPTQTTQASVFGTPTQTTQASIFGSPTPTTQASIFGSSPQTSVFGTPAQTTQASVFGSPTPTTQASVFGATTQTSVFGTPTQTTQASIFGQPATTQSGGSLFGGGESLFAAASISTTSASSPNSGGNIFGSPSGSVFGGGGSNVFGGKSSFGQQSATPSSIFGGGASFGQTPATNIWGSGNNNGSGFGSSSGFGQTATTQSSSIFGSTGGSFSQPSGGAFSAPPQPSAFGSPTQQQASGFGGGAVFGSKPLFGQTAGFGSSGFGSPASFGGLNKSPTSFGAPAFGGGSVFGGGSPGGGFATSTQSNATFESLATQNTLTFGNLAQQTASPQPAAPSFNTSPSFTGWRG